MQECDEPRLPRFAPLRCWLIERLFGQEMFWRLVRETVAAQRSVDTSDAYQRGRRDGYEAGVEESKAAQRERDEVMFG